MTTKPKHKLYASSSGFIWGRLVFTDYKTGCLRNVLLQSRGVREGEIDEKYKIMGALHEDLHEDFLKSHKIPYHREAAIKYNVTPDVQFSGRADFVIPETRVEELKSTDSKNTARNIIKNGKVRTEHLAQVIAYMIPLKLAEGRLIYGYYEKDDETGKYAKQSDRAFDILIDDAGRICIDGAPSGYTINDSLNYTKTAAAVVTSGEIWDRPHNWSQSWGSPCKTCPWSSTCDKYDDGLIEGDVAFVQDAIDSLKAKEKKNE